MKRSFVIVIAALCITVPKTDLLACSCIPSPIFHGTRSQSVIIGTVTQAARLSTEVELGSVLKSQPPSELLSLVTSESENSSCFDPLDRLYRVGTRYLLMLPAELQGVYEAPVRSPWRIELGDEPSEEEAILLSYVASAIELNASPVSFSFEGPAEFVTGKPMVVQLTLSNHSRLPLSLYDGDPSPRSDHLRFGLRVTNWETGCCDEAPLEINPLVVPPEESIVLDLDLARTYGTAESGEYEIFGVFIDVPVAPGKIYRDEIPGFPTPFMTFTVTSEDSAVSRESWGGVKRASGLDEAH